MEELVLVIRQLHLEEVEPEDLEQDVYKFVEQQVIQVQLEQVEQVDHHHHLVEVMMVTHLYFQQSHQQVEVKVEFMVTQLEQ